MFSFELTEEATRDLEDAVAYIATDNDAAALRLADQFEQAFQFLGSHPRAGHLRSDLLQLEGIRFWNTAGYLIVYLSDRSPILILAALHGARDAASIIPERLGTL